MGEANQGPVPALKLSLCFKTLKNQGLSLGIVQISTQLLQTKNKMSGGGGESFLSLSRVQGRSHGVVGVVGKVSVVAE